MQRIVNVPDQKIDDLWVQSYAVDGCQHVTRAGVLWMNVQLRCKIGGATQGRRNKYVGVTNGFKDFQELADWCQTQYGYLHKEKNGKYWHLDKDLKVFGNKVYSPETCVFVPSRVNSILVSCAESRGKYSLGTSWNLRAQKFRAYCSDGTSKQIHLGSFTSQLEAHQAWQKYKVGVIKKLISEDYEIMKHSALCKILNSVIDRLEEDIRFNRETK